VSKKLKNKTVIYWEQPSYTAVDASAIDSLPHEVKKLIVQHILDDLRIGVHLK